MALTNQGRERKRLMVYSAPEDQDSEEYPAELIVENFSELKERLSEITGVRNDGVLKVILNHTELIVTIDKIIDGKDYTVKTKVKPSIVKIYIDIKE